MEFLKIRLAPRLRMPSRFILGCKRSIQDFKRIFVVGESALEFLYSERWLLFDVLIDILLSLQETLYLGGLDFHCLLVFVDGRNKAGQDLVGVAE